MSAPTDNETWIVERGGHIVEKRARDGLAALSDWEHLVYCLWVADYMMRNAGDFGNAETLYPAFQTKAGLREETPLEAHRAGVLARTGRDPARILRPVRGDLQRDPRSSTRLNQSSERRQHPDGRHVRLLQ